MAGLTLEIAEARLTEYLNAEAAVLENQAVEIDSGGIRKKLTRADLPAIQAGIKLWQERCDSLSRNSGQGGIRASFVVHR